jgi:hypothetical protein
MIPTISNTFPLLNIHTSHKKMQKHSGLPALIKPFLFILFFGIVQQIFCQRTPLNNRVPLSHKDTKSEQYLQIITVCITNAFCIPALFIAYFKGLYPEILCGIMSIISSSLYHIGETLDRKIMGMNPGQWHRLDNIFIIAAMQNLFFFFFKSTSVLHARLRPNQTVIQLEDEQFIEKENRRLEVERWALFIFLLFCQERGPWIPIYTFLPILVALFYNMIRMIFFVPKHYWPNYNTRMISIGFLFLIVAVIFFIRGLDDEKDYLKINHGLWHCLGGIGFAILLYGKQDSKERMKYLAFKQKCKIEFEQQFQQKYKQDFVQLEVLDRQYNSNQSISIFRRKEKHNTPIQKEEDTEV